MKISEALALIRTVEFHADAHPVFATIAGELAASCGAEPREATVEGMEHAAGVFRILRSEGDDLARRRVSIDPADSEAVFLELRRDGSGCLAASRLYLLYGFTHYLLDRLSQGDVDFVAAGKVFRPAFAWQRTSYDFFLNQEGRTQKGLDKETYIRRLARAGFTHVEVNGLAYPMSLETGPKGETYPMFYTYCPALDQFVCSELNKGLYPGYYLAANLANLKRNAALAARCGLVPGLLCFEPRSVPERFFHRYPMLRGPRVDHPFRSFKPRYTMTLAHPRVREHYAEMLAGLMREVPELGFIGIWTNDSGAGFEHTRSLYVGRNGGAYLIREWRDDAAIAEAAGGLALDFFRLLRDAAAAINPDFRVITRLESFYGEHDVVWRGLGDRIDVETTSLLARGWEMPYSHPRYPDSKSINGGTVYQAAFAAEEKPLLEDLRVRGAEAHFYCAAGPNAMFAPLLGVPYPSLTHRRLKLLHENGVRHLAHCGGAAPPELAPYDVNGEIIREFQFDPGMDIDAALRRLAGEWTGGRFVEALLRAWESAEEAILAFPNISPLYSTFGFVWYRLWARPFVPDIEALAPAERAYYQDFMCTTPHNPNNVDLSRDVLFTLTTLEDCRRDLRRIDENLWEPMDAAIAALAGVRKRAAAELGAGNVVEDQLVRLEALRCWFTTQRSLAAWVAGVHGYMAAAGESEKAGCKALLGEMMEREIDNSRRLMRLLDSGVEFLATTDQGETPLIHGRNLGSLLERRIELMARHMGDEPRIDPHYIERVAGKLIE